MDPYQQPSAPQQNPYDFITNPGQPKKGPVFGGNSTKSRLIVVGIGLTVLILIATIVGSILSNAGKGDLPTLKSLVAEQQELIRVADLGKESSKNATARALAYNTSLSTATQQQKLTAYLETRGVKLNKEELAAKKSDEADKNLEAAASNNRFDEEFSKILNESLLAYNNSLSLAYKSAAGPGSKKVLEESFNNNVVILGLK